MRSRFQCRWRECAFVSCSVFRDRLESGHDMILAGLGVAGESHIAPSSVYQRRTSRSERTFEVVRVEEIAGNGYLFYRKSQGRRQCGFSV